MFSEQLPAMENAYQILQAPRGDEPSFAGLVRTGLKHLADRARDFDVCVDCDSAQSKHFFSELASLKGDSARPADPADCWLCLLEDLALFFRERFLRHPEEHVPEEEQMVMDYFESSGEWHPEDAKLVSQAYWVGLPEKWREEYRRRGSRRPAA